MTDIEVTPGQTFWCSAVGTHEHHQIVQPPTVGRQFVILHIDRPDSSAGMLMFNCHLTAWWNDTKASGPTGTIESDGREDMELYLVLNPLAGQQMICVLSVGPVHITGYVASSPHAEDRELLFEADTHPKAGVNPRGGTTATEQGSTPKGTEP